MTSADTASSEPSKTWLSRLCRRLGAAAWFCLRLMLVVWGTLAIYYSNLPWGWARVLLATAFAAFSIWALWLTVRPRMGYVFAGLFLGVVAWFASIQPSHDRPWRPEVAVMPRAYIDGDRVRLTGSRNFEYRSTTDFTVRHEEREVLLSHLTSLDLYISYFTSGPLGHTYVSFNFDNARPVCISIETRPEVGEGFAPIASLFKQFELIYVVGDELDLVRVRTNYRPEDTYLYRIRVPAAAARQLFLVYLERINELADRPEFYHLLSNSCTINIFRYANVAGRQGRVDFRHYLNGWVDRYLYEAGYLDTSLPFVELRRRSQINEAARRAGDVPEFPERIREALPGMN